MVRIRARKNGHKMVPSALLVNLQGKRLTSAVLRKHVDRARELAAETNPTLAGNIKAFWFYDLRAKAARTIHRMIAGIRPRATCWDMTV